MPKIKRITYQPSWETYKSWLRYRLYVGIGLIILTLFLARHNFLIFLGACVIIIPLGLLTLKRRVVTTKIVVEATRITYQRSHRKDVTINLTPQPFGFYGTYADISQSEITYLVIKDRETGKAIRVSGAFWKSADLVRIARAAHVDIHPASNPLTTKYIRNNYPGTLTFYAAHPILSALLLVPFLVAIVIPIAMMLTA